MTDQEAQTEIDRIMAELQPKWNAEKKYKKDNPGLCNRGGCYNKIETHSWCPECWKEWLILFPEDGDSGEVR